MFLIRIYRKMGFMVDMLQHIFYDLIPFVVFVLASHIMFSVFFMILQAQIGDEYD